MFRSIGSVPAAPATPRGSLSLRATIGHAMGAVLITLVDWHERSMQRHRLGNLDDFALKDLGLTRADVATEISKPFWRA